MNVTINGRFLNQPTTGVQRYAHLFTRELDRLAPTWGNLKFDILSPRLKSAPPHLENLDLSVRGYLQGHLWEQTEFPFYSAAGTLLCLGNTAPIGPLVSGRRVVAVVHDLAYAYFPDSYAPAFRACYGALHRLLMQKASAVITVSEAARCSILQRYPDVEKRLFVVHHGGAWSAPAASGASPCPTPFILFVGTLSRLKNFPAAIEVARRLLRSRPGLRFVFVGSAASIHAKIKFMVEEEFAGRILFAGHIEDFDQLARYYRGAELLLFPSLSESSGFPATEAMSLGCPVVASGLPAIKERCGDAVIYCDPCDISDMVGKVERVLESPDLRSRIIARGLLQARQFSWETCVRKTLGIIDSVAS
jgi:glycosyltransferase involved in cell wall biosynthesis